MLWKLFTTTKFGRRVSVPFESLTPNRLDETNEAQARYGHTNVTLHPDIRSDGNNIVSPIVHTLGTSEPVWTVLGIIMVVTFYYWWGLIVPLVAWWGFKKWIGVD